MYFWSELLENITYGIIYSSQYFLASWKTPWFWEEILRNSCKCSYVTIESIQVTRESIGFGPVDQF
jgi:hypothetical protein